MAFPFSPSAPHFQLLLTGRVRLEAATSRLEDMVPDMSNPAASTNGVQAGQFQSSDASRAIEQPGAVTPAPHHHREPLPPAIDDFDAMINAEVKTFVNVSEEIGGLVAEQVHLPSIWPNYIHPSLTVTIAQAAAVLRSFAAERKFLIITTKAKKPDIQSPVYMEILKELQSMMGAVNDIREANRASALFTHLTTVSEGITMLGWITVEPKPIDFVGEVLNGAQFYGNRVINLNKEKLAIPIILSIMYANAWTETESRLNGSIHSMLSLELYPDTSNSIIPAG